MLAKSKQQKSKSKPDKKEDDGIRGIVRVAGKDVRGHVPLNKALSHVKGVGLRYANVCAKIIANKMGVSVDSPIGSMSDEQLEEIERVITNPLENNIPVYMLNRRRDYSTGEDKHLISNDLDFAIKMDIDREKKIKSWRGISHMYRKKVRGQRTRTSGRRGGTVGVVRKKQQPGKSK